MAEPSEDVGAAGDPQASGDQAGDKTQRFFYSSILVGLVLIGVGIVAFQLLDLSGYDSRTILYAGIGIVLGAFGSTATVKLKGVVVAGVGAITIVLLWLVQGWIQSSYVEGSITGDVTKVFQIVVFGDEDFLGAIEKRADRPYRYRFIAPKSSLEQETITVEVTTDPEAEPLQFPVPSSKLEKTRGSGKRLDWRLDLHDKTLYDGQDILAKAEGGLPTPALPEPDPIGAAARDTMWLPTLISAAQAGASPEQLLQDLESPNSTVRRNTRDLLAQLGPTAVAPMMAAYRTHADSYRIRLGILVALTEMLRADKSQGPALSQQLNAGDIELLVQAIDNNDRTMRIYAAEFLYDLGDTRVVAPALSIAKQHRSPDGRYLAVFVISGAYPHLGASERASLRCALAALKDPRAEPKTSALIDQMIGPGGGCD